MIFALVTNYKDGTTTTKLIDNKLGQASLENPCVGVFRGSTHELCIQWLKRYHDDVIAPDTLNLAEWEHIIVDTRNIKSVTVNNVDSDLSSGEPIRIIYQGEK